MTSQEWEDIIERTRNVERERLLYPRRTFLPVPANKDAITAICSILHSSKEEPCPGCASLIKSLHL